MFSDVEKYLQSQFQTPGRLLDLSEPVRQALEAWFARLKASSLQRLQSNPFHNAYSTGYIKLDLNGAEIHYSCLNPALAINNYGNDMIGTFQKSCKI